MTEHNQQSLLLGKIAAYTEILVKDPGSTIFVSLAETYRRMGMYEDARQIVSKGMTLHNDFSPAFIVLARILCQLDNYSASIDAFERALTIDPDNLAALVGSARVHILLEEDTVARELLLKARNLSPADPIINKLILSLADSVIAIKPESDTIELASPTLAELYLSQGLTEKSLQIYQKLSILNPDDLSYRRKVKELSEISGNNTDTKVAVDTESSVFIDDAGVPDVAEEETFVFESDAEREDSPVLGVLNRWLNNIELGRENV